MVFHFYHVCNFGKFINFALSEEGLCQGGSATRYLLQRFVVQVLEKDIIVLIEMLRGIRVLGIPVGNLKNPGYARFSFYNFAIYDKRVIAGSPRKITLVF